MVMSEPNDTPENQPAETPAEGKTEAAPKAPLWKRALKWTGITPGVLFAGGMAEWNLNPKSHVKALYNYVKTKMEMSGGGDLAETGAQRLVASGDAQNALTAASAESGVDKATLEANFKQNLATFRRLIVDDYKPVPISSVSNQEVGRMLTEALSAEFVKSPRDLAEFAKQPLTKEDFLKAVDEGLNPGLKAAYEKLLSPPYKTLKDVKKLDHAKYEELDRQFHQAQDVEGNVEKAEGFRDARKKLSSDQDLFQGFRKTLEQSPYMPKPSQDAKPNAPAGPEKQEPPKGKEGAQLVPANDQRAPGQWQQTMVARAEEQEQSTGTGRGSARG